MKTPTDAPHEHPLTAPRVLVVGATASIGPSVVQAFMEAGYAVTGTARTCAPTDDPPPLCPMAPLDLTDAASIDAFVSHHLAPLAPLNVVVMLAGILPGRSLKDYSDDTMDRVMSTNFTGQARLIQRLLPHLAAQAHVIMVSSISGERGSFDPIYAASKAAQIAFVKSMATWLAPGIRFNALAPALIEDSTMHDAMSAERRAHHRAQSPTGRLSTKEEIAGVVVDMCGKHWRNLNGQVIRINGGLHV